jgi:hypothetical protein
MEGIFTLPWPEYAVMHKLADTFKKEDYALFVPASRQQKGIDLLLFNIKKHKTLSIQVKSSRSYDLDKGKKNQEPYGIWLNNFLKKIDGGGADYYIIYGLYPQKNSKGVLTGSWNDLFLCYSKAEMIAFLKRVHQKRDRKKPDSFFGYEFNDSGTVVTARGILTTTGDVAHEDASANLLEKKTAEMKKRLA